MINKIIFSTVVTIVLLCLGINDLQAQAGCSTATQADVLAEWTFPTRAATFKQGVRFYDPDV